jgi:protein-L-isoaspartate(D-aspartate) O-methyltransferase
LKLASSLWFSLGAFFLLCQTPVAPLPAELDSEKQEPHQKARRLMIERDLKGRGIKDARVLAAMEAVPRHRFVPDRLKVSAYDDRALPIGSGQTISQPYIVAYMSELLELKGDEKVLEIGTGSGYQAAVLARLARDVYSIEIIAELSEQARRLVIDQLGVSNLHLKVGDGFFGWAEKAPFDAILLTAATPKVPEPLWRQLREGGRIILPLGDPGQTQRLTRVRKTAGKQVVEPLSEVIFVPLTGAIERRSR